MCRYSTFSFASVFFLYFCYPIKIGNFCISLFSFDLSCSILEKDNFVKIVYTVLSCSVLFFILVSFNLV